MSAVAIDESDRLDIEAVEQADHGANQDGDELVGSQRPVVNELLQILFRQGPALS